LETVRRAASVSPTPAVTDVDCVLGGDLAVVNDSGVWRPECRDPRTMGLELSKPLAVDQLEALDLVGKAAPVQIVQAPQLAFVGGHDDLAAALDRNAVALAVGVDLPRPADAET